MKKTVLLPVMLMLSVYAAAQVHQTKIVASDRSIGDQFSYRDGVAISGHHAIVGANQDFEDASGNNPLVVAGSAYIFRMTNGTWTEVQKIVATDREAGSTFGVAVDISGDYAIVGAPNQSKDESGSNVVSRAGAAYIFHNENGTWTQTAKIVASNREALGYFGSSVAISGNYAFVGTPYYKTDTQGNNPLLQSGAVFVFKNDTGVWSEVQKIVASDRAMDAGFGTNVAISGDYGIVSAPGEKRDSNGGNSLLRAGAAYIFQNSNGTWSETQKIVALDREAEDQFGTSVDISNGHAIVGAANDDDDTTSNNSLGDAGSAYLFENINGSWTQVQKITSLDREVGDGFGASVSLSSGFAAVGAFAEDEDRNGANSKSYAGSAYIFKEDGGSWNQIHKITAWDRGGGDWFALQVDMTDKYIIAGAYRESHDASGNNGISGAGSAYIFGNWQCPIIDDSISISGATISAFDSSASYQWLDCDNGFAPIAGETNQSFTTTVNGNYAVELTMSDCKDTSDCANIIGLGVMDRGLADNLSIYPNPTSGNITIDLQRAYANVQVIARNTLGQTIAEWTFDAATQTDISVPGASGFYLIEVKTIEGQAAIVPILKQ